MSGKVALVTGASRGIGRAVAAKLAATGCLVAATATSEAGVDAINSHFQQLDLPVTGFQLNVCNDSSIENLLAMLKTHYQSAPQILVNNAGITRDNLLLRLKEAEWDEVVATNLSGVFRLTKRCLKPMVKARWGRIISIGSVSGVMGNAGQANYAAAKAGLIGFSKSLAKEVAARQITVNVVAPGFVETDMTAKLTAENLSELERMIPVQRFARVEEIAAASAFLASEEAAYITGETLNINGGLYMQ